MVSNAGAQVVRLPHSVQAGVLPAALWVGHRALSLAVLLGALWFAPLATEATGWMFATLLAAAIGIAVAQHVIARAERHLVPGAMGLVRVSEQLPRVTPIPSVVADMAELGIVIAALPFLLSRADAHGILAAVLALLGGAIAARGLVNAGGLAWHRVLQWRSEAVSQLVRTVPLAATLFVAATIAEAPTTDVAWGWACIGAAIVAVARLFGVLFAHTRLRGEGRDLLDSAGDVIAARTNIAPTLGDRTRARARVRAVIAGIVVAAVLIGTVVLISI